MISRFRFRTTKLSWLGLGLQLGSIVTPFFWALLWMWMKTWGLEGFIWDMATLEASAAMMATLWFVGNRLMDMDAGVG